MGAKEQSWKARRLAWRNRLYASPRFQNWAARIWLVRRVARARAGGLFDLVAGFTYSQTLLACVESGLLELLAEGPVTSGAVAAHCDLSPAAAERLLRAAAALAIAEEAAADEWMLGAQGAALQANPGALAMIRHHRLLYADLADPLGLLRADRAAPTALSRFWSYNADRNAEKAQEYSQLMATSQAMVAEQTFAAYDFSRHDAVLDIGGGHGAFAMTLAERARATRIGIFDLPAVLDGTGKALAARGLEERIALHPGDFFHGALPKGYDCITLNRILHDHDDDQALALLRAIRAALPRKGRLVIAEPMAGTPGAEAMGDTYFGLYLWAMNSGQPRTAEAIGAMLRAAGFSSWRRIRTPQPVISSCIVSFA